MRPAFRPVFPGPDGKEDWAAHGRFMRGFSAVWPVGGSNRSDPDYRCKACGWFGAFPERDHLKCEGK